MDALNSVDYMSSSEVLGSYPSSDAANAAFAQATHLSNAQKTIVVSKPTTKIVSIREKVVVHGAMNRG